MRRDMGDVLFDMLSYSDWIAVFKVVFLPVFLVSLFEALLGVAWHAVSHFVGLSTADGDTE